MIKRLSLLAHASTCPSLWRFHHHPMAGVLDLEAAGLAHQIRTCGDSWLLKGQESADQAAECCSGKMLKLSVKGIMPSCVDAHSPTSQVGDSMFQTSLD